MADSQLEQLGATPAAIGPRDYNTVRHIVTFLLRWQAWDEALALIDAWHLDARVTVQELRAQALSGLQHHDAAIATMRRRLEMKEPGVGPQVLLGRLLLAAGETVEAGRIATQLTQTSPDYGPAWGLLGDVYIAAGHSARAEDAFRSYRGLSPNARPPFIGLARIALLNQDGVAADAFAVQAIEEGGIDGGPQPDILRAAAAIFGAVPDVIRQDEVQQQLAARYETELEAARAVLEVRAPLQKGGAQPAPSPAQPTRQPRPARAEAPLPTAPPLSATADFHVIADEVARLTDGAQRFFGFDKLLPWQPEILAAVCRGEDVLAILPTGGGKSLCYQLPAFLDEHGAANTLTLVVSPLIALMKDQLDNLPPALRAETVAINSSMETGSAAQAWEDIARGRYRLVYLAPERLRQWPVIEALRARGVARLVVDEAHCVSSWGHNFRPDYLYLAQAHRDLGAPPILALTATAPTRVRQDIEQQLFGRGSTNSLGRRLHVIAADSLRPNLHLNAFRATNEDEKRDWLLGFCTALEGSGIVYTRTRRNCEEIAVLLQGLGIAADAYHAGLSDSERTRIQSGFMSGQTRILVATVAFGMGVDKPDIRFILHYGLAASLEAYYQEAGRAGRDGLPAHCVLLWANSDKTTLNKLVRYDAVTVAFLREIYKGVRERMRPYNPGLVTVEELARAVPDGSDTKARVALSILEAGGLLRRHYDAPRRIYIELLRAPEDAALAALAQATGLAIGRAVSGDYLDICARAGMDAAAFERDLLIWQARGFLRFTSSGRDALITLVAPPPRDAEARIAGLIDRFAAVQAQQVSEIAAYAKSNRCRHGYLSAYLGGQTRVRCASCDNCGKGDLPAIGSVVPDSDAQRLDVLRTIQERTLGVVNLAKVLAGDRTVNEAYQRMPTFGALNFRSTHAIGQLIETMVDEGLLEKRLYLESSYTVHLTANGTRLLQNAF